MCISAISFGQVIITELADPNNSAGSRYVELYVVGPNSVDFTDWELIRYTNANTTISSNRIDLTSLGTLNKGSFAIIAANGTTFQTTYGTAADINAGTGGPADSNGDDKIAIVDASDTIIDIFGVPGESSNNANNAQNFEDGRAERVASVTTPTSTWNASEWNTDNDQGFGAGAQDAPAGFDPKSWIGASSDPTISISGSGSGLDYFENNGPSEEKIFNVSGSNLTADITVTAPTNFEISLSSGSGFGSTVNLPQTSGTGNATNVYLRLAANLVSNTYSGNVTASSNGATDAILAVSGTVSPDDPQITVTAFLDDLNYVLSQGGPSAEDDFTVSGLFLTADIVVTAPTNFEVSLTSGSGFAGSVNIVPSSGTVAQTTVYVRLSDGLTEGNYNGNITVSSTGVTDELIAVNGNVFGPPTRNMIITGVYDGPLSGGTPKGVELYVFNNIPDLSVYGISSANNGGGSTAGNVEFTFPSVAATAGSFIYIASDETNFNNFFGMNPDYNDGSMSINGDDAIELYERGVIIDTFGDVDTDGNGEPWEYVDGWAYRNANSQPGGTTFTISEWSFSGVDAFDGETTNAGATTPFPIGTFTGTLSLRNSPIKGFAAYPNPVINKRLTISSQSSDAKQVILYNILGKQVFSKNISGTRETLELNSLRSGMYILKVIEGTNVSTSKLVIE